MDRVIASGNLDGLIAIAIVCTDLPGKERNKQVGMDRVIASGNIDGLIVIAVASSDLSGKEPYIQVGMDRMIESGNLDGLIHHQGLYGPLRQGTR